MKRVITVFLLVAMLLSITACGNKVTNDSSANAAQASDAAPTESPVATNSASPSPTPKDETAETLGQLQSSIWLGDEQVAMYYEFLDNGVVLPQCDSNGNMAGVGDAYKVKGNSVTITSAFNGNSTSYVWLYSDSDHTFIRQPVVYTSEDPDDPEGSSLPEILKRLTYKDFYKAWAEYIVEGASQIRQEQNAQADITRNSSFIYSNWDKLLNRVYQHLGKTLSPSDYAELESTEKTWIAKKETLSKSAGSTLESDSAQEAQRYDKAADLTKQRVYQLIEMVSD